MMTQHTTALRTLTALLLAAPLAAGAASGAVPGRAHAAAPINFQVTPAQQAVSVGDSFVLTLTVDTGEQQVDAFETTLTFPADLLEVQDMDAARGGVQITAGGTLPLTLTNSADNAKGTLTYAAGRNVGGSTALGTFNLAQATFRAKASGSAQVMPSSIEAALGGVRLDVLFQSGTVTVNAPVGGGGGGGGGGGSSTPTTPAPAPAPPTGVATVGTSGGSVQATNGVTVTVPPGAASGSLTVRVAPAPDAAATAPALPDGVLAAGTHFTVDVTDADGAAVTEFGASLVVTVPYSDADLALAGGDPARLVIYRYDTVAGAWQALLTIADTEARILRATTTRTSLFSVTAEVAAPGQLSGPPGGLATGLETTLSWVNPPGTAQFQIQVVPFNDDGPGINLIIGAPDQVQAARFAVPPPILGQGPYIVLPGMSYRWRVRTSPLSGALGENDRGWSPYVEGQFRTTPPTSATLSAVSPAAFASVTSLTPALTWKDLNPRIFYYEVQLSRDETFNVDPATATAAVYWNLVHGGESSPPNSWNVPADAALETGATYFWRVRPRVQGDGASVDWSTTWSFTTP